MKLTDLFIHRPVLSIVISLLLLVLGLRSLFALPVLQFPRSENATVTVNTSYYGADPNLVAGFITTPLEAAIAQANGIDYLTSSSRSGMSSIIANLRLNYDADKALTEISAKIDSVLSQLPQDAQHPIMSVQVGQTIDAMYIGFSSDVLPSNHITDYLVRVVQPKLQAVKGVQTAELIGGKYFALRAWLDPEKLAAYDLTAADVKTALANNDYLATLGNTKGQMVQVSLTASTSLHSVDEFKELVVKQKDGALIRLKDVANVTLGAEEYESRVSFDGNKAVYIGIQVAPAANLLEVVQSVKKVFPGIVEQLPTGIKGTIVYDSSAFVNSSIKEVIRTLFEALIIVTLVIFAFLGSLRSVVIPVVAIPLSLVATFSLMLALGFTINLLTLLALVLAIGLVVDDAIIMVENINRHLEEGMQPIPAACKAAKELAGPIIAMTVVLVAVYVPIGFQSGLTGALFTEFAFTLVGSVTVSAIVALTLSPMMCSRLLKAHDPNRNNWESKLIKRVDSLFERLLGAYLKKLREDLDELPVIAVFTVLILVSIYFLYSYTNSELAPQEDQGVILAISKAAPNSTQQQRQLFSEEIFKRFKQYPETDHVFQMDVSGQSIGGMVLKPWDERLKNAQQLLTEVQPKLNEIAGLFVMSFQPPPLPGSSGLPIQFVIGTTEPFEQLNEVASRFLDDAKKSGMFLTLDNDLKINQPQMRVDIDRNKAALMGLNMQDIGKSLSGLLDGNYVNYFSLAGRSYKVIPQVMQRFRQNPEQLGQYTITTADGATIPISTFTRIQTEVIPQSVNHFQQLNAATLSGIVYPGVSQGDALDYLKKMADQSLPENYSVDYGGQSRQYVTESSGFLTTFVFALIIIYLALSAQFESFRDPLIILVSVPMSIAGALIFISLGIGGATLNIYTEVGLVTLMGLISKHGILIVEFANTLQEQGKTKREAIEGAVSIRLRPILMTTAAMVLGVFPLIFASGAGAVSRFNIGLVIATGLSIGTLFTLFVVPGVYMLLSQEHKRVELET